MHSAYVRPAPSVMRAVGARPPVQLCNLVEVDQRRRPRAVEVELDQHVCAALDEAGLGQLRLEPERLVQRARGEDVHRPSYLSSRTWGRPRRGRRAEMALPESCRDDHEYDHGHHVRKRLEYLEGTSWR